MIRHTIEANEKPILDIFCDKYLFSIPSYQRPYAWTTEQASDLLDDITTACGATGDVANANPYFLGSIVLIKNNGPAPSARGLIRLKEIVVDWAALVTNIKPKSEHPTFRVRLALGFTTSLSCNATS
jgi:hypothetical protein